MLMNRKENETVTIGSEISVKEIPELIQYNLKDHQEWLDLSEFVFSRMKRRIKIINGYY